MAADPHHESTATLTVKEQCVRRKEKSVNDIICKYLLYIFVNFVYIDRVKPYKSGIRERLR